jgi:hypothetical protein
VVRFPAGARNLIVEALMLHFHQVVKIATGVEMFVVRVKQMFPVFTMLLWK